MKLLNSLFQIFNKLPDWLTYQIRLVVVGAKRGNPMFVGIGSTKLFLTFVTIIALLPQKEGEGWSWRAWAFFTSPPNEIGDTLAGIAGALAFLWIIVTVLLQTHELAEQRRELTLSRKAYEKTNSHLERQRFESLFFELISTHNSIVNSIDLRKKGDRGTIISNGRDCFKTFAEDLKKPTAEKLYPDQDDDKTDAKYQKLYETHHSDLGHYFRFMYNAMRVISESDFSNITHRRLFRALFSDDELLLTFYNARSSHGKKMIAYIQEFEMFDNLPEDRIIYAEHRNYFSEKCFGQPQ